MTTSLNVAILGASGYTGAEAVRLLVEHPHVRLMGLGADRKAGEPLEAVFPHLGGRGLPDLQKWQDMDWDAVDAVISCLPHGASADIITQLPDRLRVVDLSADFRLKDADTYAQWYGRPHGAPDKLDTALYGLTEYARCGLPRAKIVACPGCYPTATLLALRHVLDLQSIDPDDIVVDAKSGVSGAGRSLKENLLFSEAGEGAQPYGVGRHRHMPEIEQELSEAAAKPVKISFTPHLLPMVRGELVTCYVRLVDGNTAADLKTALTRRYASEPFVRVFEGARAPSTRDVRGSNYAVINVFEDRLPGRAIVVCAIDNLVKGSSGQAVQNLNLMFGFDETAGLTQAPLFP